MIEYSTFMMKTILIFLLLAGRALFSNANHGNVSYISSNQSYIYVTNRTSVLRFKTDEIGDIVKENVELLYSSSYGHIRSIEIDNNNKELYWADFSTNVINKSGLDGSNMTTIFKYGIGFAQGITVDWSSNILYWTDSLMKLIELSTTSGKHRKILFKLDGDVEPRAILADPKNGFLFWTDWGKKPKIERSTLSGLNRQTIISSDIVWPNDLAADFQHDRLYWIDAYNDKLESSNFDGSQRTTQQKLTYQSHIIHPYSFTQALHLNKTYITDWFSDSIFLLDNQYSNSETKLFFKNSDKQKNIGQIRFSGNSDVSVSKPCLSSLNQCSHLCLKTSSSSISCSCPSGMVLKNTTSCVEAERDIEMYFADSQASNILHLIKYKQQYGYTMKELTIPSDVLKTPAALDVQLKEKLIYWIDKNTQSVYRIQENGTGFQQINMQNRSVSNTIAIDQLNKLLYFFDHLTKALMVITVDGKSIKTIMNDGIESIYDIALYEEKGLIFFSDYERGIISRINTRGTDLKTKDLVHATNLVIDKTEDRIYWCDDKAYKIQSADLDFKNSRILIQETIYMYGRFWLIENYGNLVHPVSIALLNDQLFWTDKYKKAIFVTNKHFGGNVEYITGGLKNPNDLHVFESTEIAKNHSTTIYFFSFAQKIYRSLTRRKSIQVKNKTTCWYRKSDCLSVSIPDPKLCPVGYKESNMNTVCSSCSETIGLRFVCPCTSWENCAQRTFSKISGCTADKPWMKFKVRKCTQEIKPGLCPYHSATSCPTDYTSCFSDGDCDSTLKCCDTSCGRKCSVPAQSIENPCTINNGECSHVCVGSQYNYHCQCPDGMKLQEDGKNCSKIIDKCEYNKDPGPCTSSKYRRYYFDMDTRQCKKFNYGGCGGNGNIFTTESMCAKQCEGPCFLNDVCGTNGLCHKLSTDKFYCKCRNKFWIGETCIIDLRITVVEAKFRKKDNITAKEIASGDLSHQLAIYYKNYCMSAKCTFGRSKSPSRLPRVKRDASPHFQFTEKDTFINKWTDDDNSMTLQFIMTQPADHNAVKQEILSQKSTIEGLHSFGDSFGNVFGLDFVSVGVPLTTIQDEKTSSSKIIKGVIVGLILTLVLLCLLAAFYWHRANKKSTVPGVANQNNKSGVRWQFENKLYDGVNESNTVTLPSYDDTVTKSESYVNPAFDNLQAKHDQYDNMPNIDESISPTVIEFICPESKSIDNNISLDKKESINQIKNTKKLNSSDGTSERKYENVSEAINKKQWVTFPPDIDSENSIANVVEPEIGFNFSSNQQLPRINPHGNLVAGKSVLVSLPNMRQIPSDTKIIGIEKNSRESEGIQRMNEDSTDT